MGYFSNGTQGMDYEARYCARCRHFKPDDGGCPIWMAHHLHNYSSNEDVKQILDLLIPRTESKLDNEQCALYVDDDTPDPRQRGLFDDGKRA